MVIQAPARDDVATWAEYMRIHVVVLSLGRAVDVPALRRLHQACEDVGLPADLADDVMSSLDGYDRGRVARSFMALRGSELRFTLLADFCQLARAARFDGLADEPLLAMLSATLGITEAQHRAIACFIEACDRNRDNPWCDELTEIRFALNRVSQTGASAAAVSGTRSPVNLRSGSALAAFAGLVQLCHEVIGEDLIGRG